MISGNDTGNQVLTNKNGQIVLTAENDTYVTATLKKHVKTTHQIKKGQPEYR